jgi:hypothetical protein
MFEQLRVAEVQADDIVLHCVILLLHHTFAAASQSPHLRWVSSNEGHT